MENPLRVTPLGVFDTPLVCSRKEVRGHSMNKKRMTTAVTGFEPVTMVSKTIVLPLHYTAKVFCHNSDNNVS